VMGCTSSSMKRSRGKGKKKGGGDVVVESISGDTNRQNSSLTNVAEPSYSFSQKGEHPRLDSESANCSTNGNTAKEDITLEEDRTPMPTDDPKTLDSDPNEANTNAPARTNSKGSLIRNGIYYSESELAEEGVVWQPKYWTPERIGKWVEDTEYPDGIKFSEVRRSVLQGNHNKSPLNGNHLSGKHPSSNSAS